MRFLIMLIGVALGAVLVMKSEWIVSVFGRVDWAETHLGAEGGTRLFWKLVGLAIIFLALFYYTGAVQSLLIKLFVLGR